MGILNTHLGLAIGGVALIVAAVFGRSLLPQEWFSVLLGAGILAIALGLLGLIVDGIRWLRRPRKASGAVPSQAFVSVTGGQADIHFSGPASLASGTPTLESTRPLTDFSPAHFSFKRFKITDFPLENGIFLRGKTFDHCIIEGPALLGIWRSTQINGGFAAELENVVWTVPAEDKLVDCLIALDHCSFEDCHFEKIGVVVPKKLVEIYRDALRGKIKGFRTDSKGDVSIVE
jgi:hypothetical protein